MSIELEQEYQQLKEEYKDRYRLINRDNIYIIESNVKLRIINKEPDKWFEVRVLKPQEYKGFWAIFGLGYKEFDNEDNYAKSEFIKYIKEYNKKEQVRII